jgi:hypothetical protein
MNSIKVKDHKDLIRDRHSKAIVNTDRQGYEAYLIKQKKAQRIDLVEQKVSDLQDDIQDIKQLLQQLVSK